jgi:type IV fimbrial biogenesis protein FimT
MAENLRLGADFRFPAEAGDDGAAHSRRILSGMRIGNLHSARKGFTLVEVIVVAAIVGVLVGFAMVPAGQAMDRASVRAASDELMTALAVARELAIMRSAYVTATLDTTAGTITVESGGDTVHSRPVKLLHSVTLSATRSTIRFSPNGLGYGVSNLRVIARRRSAADTIYVSRTGRARRP